RRASRRPGAPRPGGRTPPGRPKPPRPPPIPARTAAASRPRPPGASCAGVGPRGGGAPPRSRGADFSAPERSDYSPRPLDPDRGVEDRQVEPGPAVRGQALTPPLDGAEQADRVEQAVGEAGHSLPLLHQRRLRGEPARSEHPLEEGEARVEH